MFGSQPNIKLTNSPKITPKLTKTQSFKHQRMTPKIFRKFSFNNNNITKKSPSPKPPKSVKRVNERMRPSKRDISSAVIDHRGGTITNDYWGVSLEIPEMAVAPGQQKEIYFVVTDPRLCENTGPPLDLENGTKQFILCNLVQCTYTLIFDFLVLVRVFNCHFLYFNCLLSK